MRTPTDGSSHPTTGTEEVPLGTLSSDTGPSKRRGLRRALAGSVAVLMIGTAIYFWQQEQRAVASARTALVVTESSRNALVNQVAVLRSTIAGLEDGTKEWRATVQALRTEAMRSRQQSRSMKERIAGQHAALRDVTKKLSHVSGPKLDDGRYLVYIAGITMAGEPLLTFDLLTVYSGQKAVEMANEEGGRCGRSRGFEELYIVNKSARLRTVEILPDARVRITFWHRNMLEEGKAIDLATFNKVMSGSEWWQQSNKTVSYWITVTGGSIDSIVARYVEPAC